MIDRSGFVPVCAADLAVYRIVYAVLVLGMMPSFSWVSAYPDSMYQPPRGPLRLLDGFPPHAVLVGLEVLLAVSLVALLAGRFVAVASVTTTGAMLAGYGLTYSLGKIDHLILFMLAPLFMAAAGWSGQSVVRPWVLRLWAVTVGASIATAGASKLAGGWLEPTTHATLGHLRYYVSIDSAGPLADLMLRSDSPFVWEPMDTAAVLLECGVVLAALVSWRTFRGAIGLLCLFHFAVMLMLGIVYVWNVVAYAGFLRWSRVSGMRPVLLPAWMVPVGGLAVWAVASQLGNAESLLAPTVVTVAAAVSVVVIVRSANRTGRALRSMGRNRRTRPDHRPDASWPAEGARSGGLARRSGG